MVATLIPTLNRFSSLFDVQNDQITTLQISTEKRIKQEPRFFKFKIGTANCRTASTEDKLALILRECNKAGLSMICLQESRMMDQGEFIIVVDGVEWSVIYSGGDKRSNGVCVCFKVSKYLKIEESEKISDRMMAVNYTISGVKMRLVNCYAPTNKYSLGEKQCFYEDLENVSKIKAGSKRKLMICGDFNSYCTVFHHKSDFDGNLLNLNEYESTESGQLFLDFCGELKLGSLASFFSHKWVQRATFYSNDQRTVRVYDHLLGSAWIRKHTTDARVRNNINIDSDHRCVVATMKIPMFKRDRVLTSSKKPKKRKNLKKNFRLLTQDPEFADLYTEEIKTLITDKENLSLEQLDEILESAASILPNKTKRSKIHPWDSNVELQELLSKRDKICRINNKWEHKALTKQIKKVANKLRNDFLEDEANKINQAWVNRELEKMYALSKTQFMGEKRSIGIECDRELLKQHVCGHLNKTCEMETPAEISTNIPEILKTTSQVQFDDQNLHADVPTKFEIQKAIENLKNNKSSTDMPSECLKTAIEIPEFLDHIHTAIHQVWTEKQIPNSWKYSRIISLFKKGDRMLPENYRSLSISSVMLKAIVCIILLRSVQWYESILQDGQNGFRRNRGTTDSVFVVNNLTRIARTKNKQIYALAVDLKAAYDWINRQWLWLAIAARNVGSDYDEELAELFSLVRVLYDETYSFMAGDEEKDGFRTTAGLRQGGVESPMLFGIFLDTIMRLFTAELEEKSIGGISFEYFIPANASTRAQRTEFGLTGTGKSYYSGFADDVFAYSESIEELQVMGNILDGLFRKFGLTLCLKKTKSMILNWPDDPKTYPKSIVSIGNSNIDNVKTFKYLGVKQNYQDVGTGKTEINYRMNTANFKFREYKHIFQNQSIKLHTRLLFYNCYVRSRLCYCCSIWSMSEKLRKSVKVCQMKHLRLMIRGGWRRKGGADREVEGYDWSLVYNDKKVYKICRTDPVLDFVDSQKIKWVGHVVRRGNDKMIKQSMFEVSQSTRVGTRGVGSVLDDVLKMTRNADMDDNEVWKACIDRNLKRELENRGLILTSRRNGDF